MLCLHCTIILVLLMLCVILSKYFASYSRDLISSGMHLLFLYLLFWVLLYGAYAQAHTLLTLHVTRRCTVILLVVAAV